MHRTTLIAPLTTYIMTGVHSLPEKIQRKVEETGGEICPNLMYLGEVYFQRAPTIFDLSQIRLVSLLPPMAFVLPH